MATADYNQVVVGFVHEFVSLFKLIDDEFLLLIVIGSFSLPPALAGGGTLQTNPLSRLQPDFS
jgi:hypothetical protein